MKRLRNSLFCLFTVLLLWSCDDQKEFDTYQTLSNKVWQLKDTITFDVEVQDTINPKHVFLKIRNDNSYAYSNLFVISNLQFDDGLVVKDTLEYAMTDDYGRWLGDGLTDVKESQLYFLENYTFPKSGKYTFSFTQAMRKRGDVNPLVDLKGITDIGLRIEKISKK